MDSDHDDFDDGLDDPVLAGLLTELRAIADEPAPAIGPGLAAVIGGAVPLATARTRRRTASALVLGLVSTGVLAGGISAAAADELPAPVQRVVARVVNTMTPFEIPDRAVRIPIERAPDEEVPAQPGPTERDADTSLPDTDPSPSPAKSKSDDRTTERGGEGDDESDHQSGRDDGHRRGNTGDRTEDGDRSIDDRTRDEDEDEDEAEDIARDEQPDSEGSHSGDPDEQSGSGDGSGGGGADDSDDGGVESGDQED